MLRRRGAEEAGAIFIKITRAEGQAEIFGPAPQTAFGEAHPGDRAFAPAFAQQPVPDAEAEAYLARQLRYDSDIWIVEVEDRDGRHFLDDAVVPF